MQKSCTLVQYARIIKYAEDIKLYLSFEKLKTPQNDLQNDLGNVQQLSAANGLLR